MRLLPPTDPNYCPHRLNCHRGSTPLTLAVGLPAPCPARTSMRVSSGLRWGESGVPADREGPRGEKQWKGGGGAMDQSMGRFALPSLRQASRQAGEVRTALSSHWQRTRQHVLQRGCELVGVQGDHAVVVVARQNQECLSV